VWRKRGVETGRRGKACWRSNKRAKEVSTSGKLGGKRRGSRRRQNGVWANEGEWKDTRWKKRLLYVAGEVRESTLRRVMIRAECGGMRAE
jgi:hypothetical protein